MGDILLNVDWQGVFIPNNSILEMFARGTIMYFLIVVLLRLVLKRQSGMLGMTDVLVVVLIVEVAGNGFAAEYKSVVEGAVVVSTILFWTYALQWLAQRFPIIANAVQPSTVLLVENGKMLRKNMQAELVTQEELMAQLREHGVDDFLK